MPTLRHLSLRSALLLSASLLVLSCGGEEDEPETYDPEEIIAQSVDFETNFERLDRDGILTEHDSNGTVVSRLWANEIGAEVFRTLDPADMTQTAEMPRGAIFLKESYEADGTTPRAPMQILAKFEEGYYPEANDWFFAMITREGEVIDGIAGNGFEVVGCVDCHGQQGERTDFVIGLPPEELR